MGEHRFPEETPSQREPVNPSRQLSIQPGLHGMGEPFFVQTDVGLLHLGSDPGSVLSRARGRGAGPDYGLEGLIKRDLKSPLVEDLAQAVRAVKLRRLEDQPRVR